jgi:hypothetical protein
MSMRRAHTHRLACLGCCLLAPALAVGGCEDRPPTQVMISVATDLHAPVPLRRIRMQIDRFFAEQNDFMAVDRGDVITEWEINRPADHLFELPGSFVAFADAKQEPKIRVTLEAYDAEGSFIRRRAILRLVKEKTLFMRLGVTSRCIDNADCPDDKTCVEGRCRDPVVNEASLPEYDPSKRLEFTFECNSGTAFRNTSSTDGTILVNEAATCPSPGDVCSEGTCYKPTVFAQMLPASQRLEVMVQLTNPTGMAISGADVRVEDGPLSLVRRLRSDATQMLPPTLDTGANVVGVAVQPGLYRLEPRVDSLTTELKLTVTVPGHAPQVVNVPYKPAVTRYVVPVVAFPLTEQTLAAGETRTLMASYAGQTASIAVPAQAREQRIRYALMDGRFAPGGAVPAGVGGLLQSVAVLYLENAGQAKFAPGTRVTLGTGSTAPVVGAESSGGSYVLDLQGQWKRTAVGAGGGAAGALEPATGGFWTVANHTPKPACVRGKILKFGGQPCTGARVRLLGPEGVSAFDSTGSDGSFCAAAAQQEAAILGVGGNTRMIYVPATPRSNAQCGQSDACTDIGEVTVETDECDRPAMPLAGRAQPGQACASTLQCGGLATCYQGFCVGEGYVRVSMTWGARSDFDLHVRLPDGHVLNERSRELAGVGRMDIEQCAQTCEGDKHLENVVLSAGAPAGEYQAWVENFGGAAAGPAQIEVIVAGKPRAQQSVTVPAAQDGKSGVVTFTLP